jgi:hypothetical protein
MPPMFRHRYMPALAPVPVPVPMSMSMPMPVYHHCCCDPMFLTVEEELKMLEEYKQRLLKEIESIDQRTAELKKKK